LTIQDLEHPAGADAIFSFWGEETVMRNTAIHSTFHDLRNDLRAVARDAESLLRATADVTGDRVNEIRSRTEETVRRAYDHLNDRRTRAKARGMVRDADIYVRDHSWAAIGVAVGLGVLLGTLIHRGGNHRPWE